MTRGHAWQRGRAWQGACVARGYVAGDMCGRRACMAEGVHGKGGLCGRRDSRCSGRYASYWNAFLFKL